MYSFFLLLSIFINQELKKVVIKKVSFFTYTALDVHCEDFEYQLTPIDSIVIYGFYKLDIERQLTQARRIESGQYRLDVRAKVYLCYYSGRIDSFCLAPGTLIEHNGEMLEMTNDSLSQWLMKLDL